MLSCCNWSKQEGWLFMTLLPTSCTFGPLGASPRASLQPPMALSSRCHLPLRESPSSLAAASTSGAGHHSPIYHSLQLAASLNKRSPSYFAIMLCSQAQLFPVPGKDGAELGNSPRTYAFVFSPLRPKQAGLQLLNTPRKAGVRLGWCLARGAGWPS